MRCTMSRRCVSTCGAALPARSPPDGSAGNERAVDGVSVATPGKRLPSRTAAPGFRTRSIRATPRLIEITGPGDDVGGGSISSEHALAATIGFGLKVDRERLHDAVMHDVSADEHGKLDDLAIAEIP